ncbi:hypothetical protein Pcinc_016893 [Petrolisthes cinctipes]|uniref:Crossover junction endonuclease MUS81 n=1 Tax=Petrolisthes cinctipes TaxID=88211 RepID=A0AAE1FQD9_PETCI|nr:hypothetical protein Pcinc_016893 [Petrolisthes cinctipes]
MNGEEVAGKGGMQGKKKKYRRVKRVLNHANPLFDQWLKEWQEEAQKKDSMMRYNYQRARRSLALFPLPLYSGNDCKVLAHFGTKLCEKLNRHLEEYEKENGPIDWDEVHKVKDVVPKRQVKRRKRGGMTTSTPRQSIAGTTTLTAATPQGSRGLGRSSSGSGSKGRRGREYVPVVRSGAYAILIALHNAAQQQNYKGFLKKVELIKSAQPHCDASLTVSAEGSHYTAWSSSTTLVKKGLVLREGNPARYSLTPEGETLAARIESAENNLNLDPVAASPVLPGISTDRVSSRPPAQGTNTHLLSDSSDDEPCIIEESFIKGRDKDMANNVEEKELSPSPLPSPPLLEEESDGGDATVSGLNRDTNKLRFCYVTSLGIETPMKDHAAVTVEDDGFLGFLVKCHTSDINSLASSDDRRLDKTRTAPPGFVYAYVSNARTPEISPGLLAATPVPSVAASQSRPNPRVNSMSGTSPKRTVRSKRARSATTHKKAMSNPVEDEDGVRPVVKSARSTTAWKRAASTIMEEEDKDDPKAVMNQNQAEDASVLNPLFTLQPEEYEIVLCVDNQETSGKQSDGGDRITGRHITKDIIISELGRHGVTYDVRKLNVGDFLWICRELVTNGGGERREVVLPYIVERKRMDDLASSIKDGRFKEQKFRLRQGGWAASRPIYLVEEFNSKNLSLPESTCLQAIANTQIVDEFTVKVTHDQRESAAYLTIMTRCLQSRYQDKAVSGLKREDVLQWPQDPGWDRTPQMYLPTFQEFNTSCAKTQLLKVREMLAKQLLQMYGLSVDKARAIVDQYGTPRLLNEALEELASLGEEEQGKMLAGLKFGKSGRSLGPALSINISRLYTRESLL